MQFSVVSLVFSTFFVTVGAVKFCHLFAYFNKVPVWAFLVFLPTFFVPDFLAICLLRALLRPVRGWFTIITAIIGTLITLVTLGAGSSQLSFWAKTGAEVEWREAKNFIGQDNGIQVLLTGLVGTLVAGGCILAASWFAQGVLYKIVGNFLAQVYEAVVYVPNLVIKWVIERRKGYYRPVGDGEGDDDLPSDMVDNRDSESHELMGSKEKLPAVILNKFRLSIPSRSTIVAYIPRPSAWLIALTAGFIWMLVTLIVRPKDPYDHMSTTVPIHFLDIFLPEPDLCSEQRGIAANTWPYPDLINKDDEWLQPSGDFKGWQAGGNRSLAEEYIHRRRPDWLPDDVPRGFLRWDPERWNPKNPISYNATVDAWGLPCPAMEIPEPFYNPVSDPLKISNLDNDILEPLREQLADIKIKNVVFILMESLRQELFPIKQGSAIHQSIISASEKEDQDAINLLLSQLTPNTEKITGLSGGFTDSNGKAIKPPQTNWEDTAEEGYGGINIMGSHTMATLSTKSFGSSHCGVWPMPVERFDEADTDPYNPCMIQLLELFNRQKDNETVSDDFRDWQWWPALFEAETETYDRQDYFDQKMGFKHTICLRELENDAERYNASDPNYIPNNYFGLPEPVLKPYIRDYVHNATKNKQRMWLSHFTSSTHHAFGLPAAWEKSDYLPHTGSNNWHNDFNKYLQTIRYHDAWLGELLEMFEELGMTNETLIVFAGDHGQTFKEDYHKILTYDVPHVSAFRVPIVFRHPHLPRFQYQVNASTLNILPTIVDLLRNTGSLDKNDKTIADELIHEYQGQSLLRPYQPTQGSRRAWNFHVINIGAGMMAVTSADTGYRMVLPVSKTFEFRFTDLSIDPEEGFPTTAWDPEGLTEAVHKKHGTEAAKWAKEAIEIARWHTVEQQRLWRWRLLKTKAVLDPYKK